MIRVSASEFKAKLGRYIGAARAGKVVTVTDRDLPVAKLIPFDQPAGNPALVPSTPRDPSAPPLGELKLRPLGKRRLDSTALLLADRQSR